jgi:IclR family transcriptional regulator, pca regulon regulatory protein
MRPSIRALPTMERLSERVHESCSASVLDGDEIVYVARVPTKRIMTIALALGSRLPPSRHRWAGSCSRISPTRSTRPSRSHSARAPHRAHHRRPKAPRRHVGQGPDTGMVRRRSGARDRAAKHRRTAPRRDGRVVAAMNISTQAARVSIETMRAELLPALLEAAAEIDEQLAKR